MNVLMFSSVFSTSPLGGGALSSASDAAQSIAPLCDSLRSRGHRVLVVTPEKGAGLGQECDVVRIPELATDATGADSRLFPIPGFLSKRIRTFQPHVVHTHDLPPLGSLARAIAAACRLPMVFTCRQIDELRPVIIDLVSGERGRLMDVRGIDFANQCDRVIAPSQRARDRLRAGGVRSLISVVPSGIDPRSVAGGDRQRARQKFGIPLDAFVVGHVGRLYRGENLEFLLGAASRYLQQRPASRLLVVGDGPMLGKLQSRNWKLELSSRIHWSVGALAGRDLADAYAAMDAFATASQSEAESLPVVQALTAGLPVIALDGPGAADIVRDGVNGCLLPAQDEDRFAAALATIERRSKQGSPMESGIAETAAEHSLERVAARLVRIYSAARRDAASQRSPERMLPKLLEHAREEYLLWSRISHGMYDAALDDERQAESR